MNEAARLEATKEMFQKLSAQLPVRVQTLDELTATIKNLYTTAGGRVSCSRGGDTCIQVDSWFDMADGTKYTGYNLISFKDIGRQTGDLKHMIEDITMAYYRSALNGTEVRYTPKLIEIINTPSVNVDMHSL